MNTFISRLSPLVMLLLALVAYHYHGEYQDASTRASDAEDKLKTASEAIAAQEARQRELAALDAKYTKELADARTENETLRADVATGRKRLRVNASCSAAVREATGPTRVDNATSPRLADTAERDYFTLRERLMTMQKQLEGAQEYIRTQCIK